MDEGRYREAERRLWESVGLTPTEQRVRQPRLGTGVRVQEVLELRILRATGHLPWFDDPEGIGRQTAEFLGG